MVKMINKKTGSYMYVSEDRVEEYKAAGHKLAASISKSIKPKQSEPQAKKTTKKK